MIYVMPFLLAMVVTMLWLPVFARYAARLGIIDQPGGRKVHANPIPRIGGFAMAIGVLVAALIVVPLETQDRYFLGAAAIIALFGGLDDRFDLHYRIKLAAQLLAALIVVIGGHIEVQALTLDDRVIVPEWLSIPLSIVFIVGITNAINLADGLDGLAGGTTFLSLFALAMLAYSGGQVSSAALALAFAGAVLGFLRFNTFPASVFMGDAGSQLLGFAVAVLSVRATQGSHSVVSSAIPLLLLALPILDTLSVMGQRIREGRSPFSADRNHIHHKLLALDFRHHEAVMIIYAIQADLFLLAYWMRFESDVSILAAVAGFFASALLVLHFASRRGWKFRLVTPEASASAPAQASPSSIVRMRQWLSRASYRAIALSLGAYFLLVVCDTRETNLDVRYLLAALLIAGVIAMPLMRGKGIGSFEKAVLYVTTAIVVHQDVSGDRSVLQTYYIWTTIVVMAIGTVVRLRVGDDRRFELTPLDIIVLFVALVLPSLADSIGLPDGVALGIAKLMIVFYAIEVLASRIEMRAMRLRLAVLACLVIINLRPFI